VTPIHGSAGAPRSPGCACDGEQITIVCTGLPDGYVSTPLARKGACVDGGWDACVGASPCLSTVTCAIETDCQAMGTACDPCLKLCGCGALLGAAARSRGGRAVTVAFAWSASVEVLSSNGLQGGLRGAHGGVARGAVGPTPLRFDSGSS